MVVTSGRDSISVEQSGASIAYAGPPEGVCARGGCCLSKLEGCLGSWLARFVCDWGPLCLFYALQGSGLGTASAAALGLGLACMLVTHCRSLIDPRAVSPKVLDVGFVATFVFFAGAGFVCAAAAALCGLWANALMDGAIAAIVLAGIMLGQPFVAAFAVEAGLPASIATDPYFVAVMTELTWPWLYAFAAMTAVSSVASLYACLRVDGCLAPADSTYDALNAWF
eukprot:SAG31_NODE_13323_length_877_cov_0.835476_1_plen_224_part_10